ncbi:hypothetical protein BJI47_01285 [Rhodococcus sp. 1168]|nr:hypothetical protein BJI47_01285 [Rhodococcus sp. 1168]
MDGSIAGVMRFGFEWGRREISTKPSRPELSYRVRQRCDGLPAHAELFGDIDDWCTVADLDERHVIAP